MNPDNQDRPSNEDSVIQGTVEKKTDTLPPSTGETDRDWKGDRLTHKVIEAIIRVHQTLGPGFVECIYRNALLVELRCQGLSAEIERRASVRYRDVVVGIHRSDIVVEGSLMVEVKTVSDLAQVHYAQTRSCLKAMGLGRALLVNFSKSMADFRRIDLRLPEER